MAISTREVTPFVGAEVLGVDLRDLSASTQEAINAAFARHGALVFRDQKISDDDLLVFSRGLGDLDTRRIEGDFSIVTTPREDLELLQCIPHIDTVDPGQIAVLHYLCRPEHGGTAFYRHRRTGFESVSAGRLPVYEQAIDADLRALGHPGRDYIHGDTPMFERIAHVGAAFNRLVLYPSMILHSGSIGFDYRFDADPASGRLTANAFLQFLADG